MLVWSGRETRKKEMVAGKGGVGEDVLPVAFSSAGWTGMIARFSAILSFPRFEYVSVSADCGGAGEKAADVWRSFECEGLELLVEGCGSRRGGLADVLCEVWLLAVVGLDELVEGRSRGGHDIYCS